jgi:hypothetical protein
MGADAGFAIHRGTEEAAGTSRMKGADMNAITRRAAIGMMALSLAFGAAAGFSGHASAMPKLGAEGDCTYAGQTYSEGSVITMSDGKNYVCHDGHWDVQNFTVSGGSRFPTAPIGPASLGS